MILIVSIILISNRKDLLSHPLLNFNYYERENYLLMFLKCDGIDWIHEPSFAAGSEKHRSACFSESTLLQSELSNMFSRETILPRNLEGEYSESTAINRNGCVFHITVGLSAGWLLFWQAHRQWTCWYLFMTKKWNNVTVMSLIWNEGSTFINWNSKVIKRGLFTAASYLLFR